MFSLLLMKLPLLAVLPPQLPVIYLIQIM
ncbi:uncharacterized protein METZ01_LOCUS56414 [marine metagenome]|uniref:Uncharacterized protein n=1 Tax=marine metagenome TaxID=408172 RepID=A0A381SHM6_9ZZZZ